MKKRNPGQFLRKANALQQEAQAGSGQKIEIPLSTAFLKQTPACLLPSSLPPWAPNSLLSSCLMGITGWGSVAFSWGKPNLRVWGLEEAS